MMTKPKKPTDTQRRVQENAAAGRRLDQGRAYTQSAAAGWGCSIDSCVRAGWLAPRTHAITDDGWAALATVNPHVAYFVRQRQGGPSAHADGCRVFETKQWSRTGCERCAAWIGATGTLGPREVLFPPIGEQAGAS